MKNLILLLLCCVSVGLTAQQEATIKGGASGMTFVEKPFAELLAQAKAEDKVIFIDAYTTWCGPCKMMAKQVFPLPEVGAVYNDRFINAKIDMEKGEGPEIAKRYSVMAYPTYLFVDGNGDIVHKGLGYIPGEAFLALADAASGPNSLGALNKKYADGERSSEFLVSYAEVLTDVYEQTRADEVTDTYLKTQDDWNTPATLKLLVGNPGPLGGERMKYLLANSEAAIAATSAERVVMTLQEKLITDRMMKLGKRGLPAKEDMTETYDEFGGAMAPRLKAHYAMFHAQNTGDTDAYVPAALAYLDAYGSDSAAELNSIAWTIFEQSDDEQELATALKLAQQSVAIEATYPNMDTLAWLYHKTGNGKMAKETARKAIEMAKESGQDYAETAKILEK